MIMNNEDLLPLNSNGRQPGEAAGTSPLEEAGDFASIIAGTFDSVDLLMAARAEADEAEARAIAKGETALPFVKEDRKAASRAGASSEIGRAEGILRNTFTIGGSAADEDSPAAMNLGGSALSALSDASGIQTKLSAKDFMSSDPAGEDFHAMAARNVVSGDERELCDVHIDELLRMTVQSGASDLHLSVGRAPMVRKDGRLVPLPFEKAQERDTQRIVFDILNNTQIEKFERTHELDFSYGVKGVGRFRFNVYRQRSSVGCAMRVIPNIVPSMEQLKLPR